MHVKVSAAEVQSPYENMNLMTKIEAEFNSPLIFSLKGKELSSQS